MSGPAIAPAPLGVLALAALGGEPGAAPVRGAPCSPPAAEGGAPSDAAAAQDGGFLAALFGAAQLLAALSPVDPLPPAAADSGAEPTAEPAVDADGAPGERAAGAALELRAALAGAALSDGQAAPDDAAAPPESSAPPVPLPDRRAGSPAPTPRELAAQLLSRSAQPAAQDAAHAIATLLRQHPVATSRDVAVDLSRWTRAPAVDTPAEPAPGASAAAAPAVAAAVPASAAQSEPAPARGELAAALAPDTDRGERSSIASGAEARSSRDDTHGSREDARDAADRASSLAGSFRSALATAAARPAQEVHAAVPDAGGRTGSAAGAAERGARALALARPAVAELDAEPGAAAAAQNHPAQDARVESTAAPAPTPDAALGALANAHAGPAAPAQGATEPRAIPQLPARAEAQILEQTRLLADQRGGEVHLSLEPPQLGGLDLRIRVTEHSVQLQMLADRMPVAELIARHMPELQQALEARGLHVSEASIEFRDRGENLDPRDGRAGSDHSSAQQDPGRPGGGAQTGERERASSRWFAARSLGAVDLHA